MWSLAQTTTIYTTSSSSSSVSAIWFVLYVLFIIAIIVGYWKIFTKAGEAGWKSLIPIYNTVILLKIVGMSGWFVLVFLIPFVNVIFAIIVAYRLSKCFGYGVGMTILQFLIVGELILGFGDAKYLGPKAAEKAAA